MTPKREAEIRQAWRQGGARMWRWGPSRYGETQTLRVPILPPAVSLEVGPVPVESSIAILTFIGQYATFPGGEGPDRPRYRFITCEGLIVHHERVQ